MLAFSQILDISIISVTVLIILVSVILLGGYTGEILKHVYLRFYLQRVEKDFFVRMKKAVCEHDGISVVSLSRTIKTVRTLSSGSSLVLSRAFAKAARESFFLAVSLTVLLFFI